MLSFKKILRSKNASKEAVLGVLQHFDFIVKNQNDMLILRPAFTLFKRRSALPFYNRDKAIPLFKPQLQLSFNKDSEGFQYIDIVYFIDKWLVLVATIMCIAWPVVLIEFAEISVLEAYIFSPLILLVLYLEQYLYFRKCLKYLKYI